MKRALLFCAATALTACAAPDPAGEAASTIVGGTPTSGDPAVVMLVSVAPDQSTFDACTASLIAPDVLLTAAHCLDPATHAGYTYGAFLGADASAYPTAALLAPQLAAVKETHPHPEYDAKVPFHADIGVAILAAPLAVTPLPRSRAPLDASLVGSPARIVGYGQTKYGTLNEQKHEATTVVAAVEAGDTILVGDVMHHGCVGDSGGPALVKIAGVETIAGVDSYTDTMGCLEAAHYRRPDLYAPFLDMFAPPPATVDAGTGGAAGEGGAGGGGGAVMMPASGGCAAVAHAPRDGAFSWLTGALIALAITRRRALRRAVVS